MRTLLCALCMTVLCGTAFAGKAKVTLVNMNDTQSGNRLWEYNGFSYGCPSGGSTCYVIVTVDDGHGGTCEDVLPAPPALKVTAKVGTATAYNTITNQTSTQATTGFTFLNGEYKLRIDEYPDKPQYNGVSVFLNGISIASDGTFQVIFPYIP